MEYTELDRRIIRLAEEVVAAARDELRWHQVWDSVKEISSHFKEVRYPTRQLKDDAWKQFQNTIADLKIRQNEWREGAAKRVVDLENEIEVLGHDIDEVQAGSKPAREAWDRLKAIRGSFKGVPFPSKDSREELWSRVNQTAARLEEYAKAQYERRVERNRHSAEYRDEIIQVAESTKRPDRSTADMLLALFATPVWLAEKALDALLDLDSEKMDLQSRSATMKEGWRLLKLNGPKMLRDDGTAARAALDEAQQELNEHWATWKGAQQQAYEARARAREEQKESRREHVQEVISRLEAKIAKAEQARDYTRSRIEELEEKRDSAWSDGYREGVSNRIGELEERLDDIEESLNRMNEWLDQELNRLSALE